MTVVVETGSETDPLDATGSAPCPDVILEVIGAGPLPLPPGILVGDVVGLSVWPDEAPTGGAVYDGERVLA